MIALAFLGYAALVLKDIITKSDLIITSEVSTLESSSEHESFTWNQVFDSIGAEFRLFR